MADIQASHHGGQPDPWTGTMPAHVVAVSASHEHTFSKPKRDLILLLEGFGVDGDAHAGATVKHRSRVARDAAQPNLRQVHLLPAELLDGLVTDGYVIAPGALGENVTTRGIDLLALGRGSRLRLGESGVVEITGLRNPCMQLDRFATGLMRRLSPRDEDGNVRRLAGVMGIVVSSGYVHADDVIEVVHRPERHQPLEVV